MSATRKFHLGDVLCITGEKLVSPRHIEGVYDILNFMTGDSLYTHQLPRAMRQCRPILLEQYPWLAEVDDTEVTGENWREWLASQVEKYGEEIEVAQLKHYESINPLDELTAMAGEDRVIVVQP
jgi:hypothetical protein